MLRETIERISSRLERWIRSYAEWIVRWRRPAVLLTVLLVAICSAGLLKLDLIADWRIFVPKGSGIAESYIDAVETFGTDERAVLILRNAEHGVLSNPALEAIGKLTDRLWKVDGVKRVDSLVNYPAIRASRVDFESPALAVSEAHVAAAGERGDVLVWRRGAWSEPPLRLSGHGGMVEHLLFTADGKRLVSGAVDRTVRIWELGADPVRAQVLEGAPEQISALLLSPDGQTIYAGSYRAVLAWSVASGELSWKAALEEDYVTALLWSENRLLAASKALSVLDPASGKIARTIAHHEDFVTVLLAAPDGTIHSAAADGTIVSWDRATLTPAPLFSDPAIDPLAMVWDPKTGALLAGFTDGTIRTIGASGSVSEIARAHDDWVVDLTLDAAGNVYSGSRDRDVVVQRREKGSRFTRLRTHRAAVRRIAVSDGELFSSGDDGDVFVRSTADLELVARLHRGPDPVTTVASKPFEGAKEGRLVVKNDFRLALDVFADGELLGTVEPAQQAELRGIAVGEPRACDDDSSCVEGEYCDLEAEEPYCSRRVVVSAKAAGTDTPFWKGLALLDRDHFVSLRIPGDDAFSITTIEPRLSAETQADTFGAEHSPLRLPIQPFRFREYAYHLLKPPNPPAKGQVINAAGDTTLIAVQIDLANETVPRRVRVMATAEEVYAAAKSDDAKLFEAHVTGEIMREDSLFVYGIRDRNRLFPLSLVVISLLLYVAFRRLAGVLIPMAVVLSAVIVSMGASGWLGVKLNLITVNVGQIVVVVCIGEAVHVFNTYSRYVARGATSHQAAVEAVVTNFAPCFWTNLTTALGFFALSWAGIEVIDSFGRIAGLSVLFAFVAGFVLLPGIMATLPAKKSAENTALAEETRTHGMLERLLSTVAAYVNRTGGTLLALGGIVLIIAGLGLSRLIVDSNPLLYFTEDAPVRMGAEFVEKHISGPAGLRLVVDTGEPGGVRKVEHLNSIARLTDHLAADPWVAAISSLGDIERGMNRALNQDLPHYYRVPETDAVASAYYDAYSFGLRGGMELTNRVSDGESRTAIDIQLKSRSSEAVLAWSRELRAWMDANVPGLNVTITGGNWVDSNVGSRVARAFYYNLSSALLQISLLLIIVARGVRLGGAAIMANLAPLVIVIGALGIVGRELDIAVLMACCVAFGIVVDDTIHFVTHYRRLREAGHEHEDAVTRTMLASGRALVLTTVLLSVGIGMYILTDFALNQRFGVTTILILLAGLICDLLFLPPLLRYLRPGRVKI